MVTLVHTSPVHVATFDALGDEIAPDVELMHLVREDWLARARALQSESEGDTLNAEIAEVIAALDGPVLCTCTSIGAAAQSAGAVRIDDPMMAEAARLGGPILMVYALQSTAEPSLAALEAALAAREQKARVHPLFLGEFWPLFEAGQTEAFIACVATGVREECKKRDFACVILAQASMAPAAKMLGELDVPVLTSPELALRAALAR